MTTFSQWTTLLTASAPCISQDTTRRCTTMLIFIFSQPELERPIQFGCAGHFFHLDIPRQCLPAFARADRGCCLLIDRPW